MECAYFEAQDSTTMCAVVSSVRPRILQQRLLLLLLVVLLFLFAAAEVESSMHIGMF
jgi:hypothetical protein